MDMMHRTEARTRALPVVSEPVKTNTTAPYAPRPEAAAAPAPANGPAEARARFARIERANIAVESGGRFVASRLATTAGAPASIGRAQLLVRLQVDELERLPDATLTSLRLDRPLLASIDRRGQAALDYYDFFVRGETRPSLPLDRTARTDAKAMVQEGDFDGVVARFGADFEARTGIPAAELGMLARTRALILARARTPAVGVARAASDPNLDGLRTRLGPSLERYLRKGNLAENRAGWYTRAAMSVPGEWNRLESGLRNGGDEITSRRRHMRNFRAAEDVLTRVGGAGELTETARTRIVGQLARVAHASPSAFQSLFGSGAALRTLADVRARIDALIASPEGSGQSAQLGRALRSFTRALDEDATRA